MRARTVRVRPQVGAANGRAEGGGVDFFVGGRISWIRAGACKILAYHVFEEGVSGGELNEGSEGNEGTYCALGGEYRCLLDGDGVRPQVGVANGRAAGGGVDFFVDGRI